jgi:hypothetical protein
MPTTRKKVLLVEEDNIELDRDTETRMEADNIFFEKGSSLYTADNIEAALKQVNSVVEGNFNFSNATSFEVFNQDSVSSTTSGTFQTKLTGTTTTDIPGKYVLQWSAELANSSNNNTTIFRVQWKPTLSPTWVDATSLDVFVGRSDIYQSTSGFRVIETMATDTIDFRVQYAAGGATASIKFVSVYIFRVEI